MKFKNKKNRLFSGLLFILTLVLCLTLAFKLTSSPAHAAWFDDTYGYRHKVTFTHNADITGDRAVTFTLDTAELITASLMQADCDDTRFTDVSGKPLYFDLTGTCNNATTTYEVIFPTVVNGANVFYVYYGNSTATNSEVNSTPFTALTPSGGDPSLTNPTSSGNQETGTGPLAYWGFNEGSGANTQDGTSSNNDGTVNGATWKTEDACITSKCLEYDGSNDYVSMGDPSNGSLDFTDGKDFSISGWFKTNDFDAAQAIVAKKTGNTAGTVGYLVQITAGAKLNAYVSDGTDQYFRASVNNLVANKWYHFTFIFDENSSTNSIFYVNGQPESGNTTGTIGDVGDISNSQPLIIGSESDFGTPFDGNIDEVKIYNYVRTAAQIKTDFQSQSATEGTSASLGTSSTQFLSEGLVGYWKMDEASAWATDCSTESILDSSGNSNHGAPCPNASAPALSVGKFGTAGNFDGSNDYADIDDATSIQNLPGNAITATAWFNADTLVTSNDANDTIISKSVNGDHNWHLTLRGTGSATQLNATIDNVAVSRSDTAVLTLATSTWYHVAMTYDNNSTRLIRIYLNGQEITYSMQTAMSGSYGGDSSAALLIGAQHSTDGFFDGKIDDARIYNRVLTNTELAALYNWAPNPLIYYPLDEGTGTSSVTDRSGNSYTGTLSGVNSNDWVQGKFGSAIDFDTVNFISGGSDTTLDNLPQISASAWIKPRSEGNTFCALISKSTSGTTDGWRLTMDQVGVTTEVNVGMTVDYDGGTDASATYNTGITLNNWMHVAGTWSGSTSGTSITLYVNGQRVTPLSTTNGTGNRETDAAQDFQVGEVNNDSRGCDSIIDEVRVYNYVRTASQVIQDMNGGHPLGGSPIGSMTGHWRFDEGADNTCSGGTNDICNSGSHSTTLDGTTSGATRLLGSQCKINGCLNFDGTDDVATITNVSQTDLNDGLLNGFTITTWVYADSDGENDLGQIWQKGDADTFIRVDSQDGSNNLDLEVGLALGSAGTSDDATANISDAFTTAGWNHVAVGWTNDSDDEISVYVNGRLRATSTTGSGDPEADTGNMLIGGATTANFDGLIDEFKLYVSELTTSEISIDYNAGFSTALGGVLGTQDNEGFSGNPPVGIWNMNENSGTGTDTVRDTSGNGSHGDTSGMTVNNWVVGKSGSALSFDGTNDYVDIGTYAVHDGDSAASISMWIRPTFDQTHSGSPYLFDTNRLTIRFVPAADDFRFSVFTGSSSDVDTQGLTWTANTWHHLVTTYDGSNMYIYWDGALQNSAAKTGTLAAASNTKIGVSSGLVAGTYWPGVIDEVRTFDYALSASQVAYYYNRGSPIAHYKFDECQGTTAYNSTSNSNNQSAGLNGTINATTGGNNDSAGACNSGAADPSNEMWNAGTTGKFNSSLSFDGTNDYVSIASDSRFGITADITLSAWIKRNSLSQKGDLIVKTNASSVWDWELGIDDTGQNDKIFFYADAPSAFVQYSTGTISDTNWHHVAFTRSGTSTTLYIDGLPSGTSTANGAFNNNSVPVYIGGDGVNALWFSGQIDDVRIYNYSLTGNQIKQVYNQGNSVRFGPATGTP